MKIWYVVAKVNGVIVDNFIASFTKEEALGRAYSWVFEKFGNDADIESIEIELEEDLSK